MIVLLLYLVYPSISASVLGLWKCEEVDRVGTIFVVDPETLCTDLSHREWTHGVGVPSILVYVLGLPAMAMGVMHRFRHKLDEQHTRVRFGLLYDGFKRENYLHECWVVTRKVLVIVIGIFSGKLQVLLAVGSVDRNLYGLDPDSGELVWSFATDGVLRGSPAATDGSIYCGSGDGHVYAIDTATGGMLWRFEVDGPVYAPVSIGERMIAIATESKSVYVFGRL